ncbi:MAG: hypothetical protein QXU40_01400 [Candidatus Pacearchaeota archaeon]
MIYWQVCLNCINDSTFQGPFGATCPECGSDNTEIGGIVMTEENKEGEKGEEEKENE